MTIYAKILKEFEAEGYREDDKLNQFEIEEALDTLADKNANIQEFNRDIAKEIFQQTQHHDGKVMLKSYINTIIKGNQLLLNHIKKNQEQLRHAPSSKHQQLQYNIQQFKSDYELVTKTFMLQGAQFQRQMLRDQSRMSVRSNLSGIFSQSSVDRQESGSLKITFIILIFSILMEFIMMFIRHHFLNLFAYLLVLSIFLLNFFDKTYLKTVIYSLALAILSDFTWIIVEANNYWGKFYITYHSTLQTGFLKFVYLMTLILMIGKIAMISLIYKFKYNNSQTRKTMKLMNVRFDLDGANRNNPFNKISWKKKI